MIKIGHSGLESALCKLPQEVKPHQEDEDIPGQVIEPVELIQTHNCGRCDQNDEDSERALLHGVNLLQSIYFKMEVFWLNASRFLLTLEARDNLTLNLWPARELIREALNSLALPLRPTP